MASEPGAVGSVNRRLKAWLAIFLGLLAGGVASAAVWLLWPPAGYEARALICFVLDHPILPAERTAERDSAYRSYLRSQAALVRSRFVLNQALAHPEIRVLGLFTEKTDPSQWLEKNLEVSVSQEALRISLTGHRSEQLVAVVDAVAKTYVDSGNSLHTKKIERLEQLRRLGVIERPSPMPMPLLETGVVYPRDRSPWQLWMAILAGLEIMALSVYAWSACRQHAQRA